ncbi:MAG: PVC-type heme-binding CxxCH protein [Planctomycetales bacterium]
MIPQGRVGPRLALTEKATMFRHGWRWVVTGALGLLWVGDATAATNDATPPASDSQQQGVSGATPDAAPLDEIPRPQNPAESLASIQVRPGFRVELMAAEPLTYDPVAFAFGADGKLWVAEMGDYPLGEDTPRPRAAAERKPSVRAAAVRPVGRIRFLEDTDDDGQFDRSTLFLEVPYPTGVLPWRRGVLITSAPHILYAEDTDGDGRADHQETLYTGFVEGNQQHRLNGLVRGLDNWIYVANGDSGGEVRYVGPSADRPAGLRRGTGLPGAAQNERGVNISGRDLRIRPETGALEAVTGQSQFGRSRDDWGNWFGCNNSNAMYQFVLDDRYQRRNRHFAASSPRSDVPEVGGNAPVFPRSRLLARFNDYHTANRLTSACSVMVYRDDLFGPPFQGNMFVSEPVHNLIHREVMSAEGVTFRSRRADDERESEFLASSDNWFRPTMIATGPDGALWIADMYRQVIEHPQWIPDTWQKKLDLQAGFDQGRIYRVYPTDAKPRPIPRLATLDDAGLVAALDSPSGWQRDTAQQLLVERHGGAGSTQQGVAGRQAREAREAAARCVTLLERLAREGGLPQARVHALWTLDGLGHTSVATVRQALSDSHPGVRRQAIRLSESLTRPPPDLLARLLELVADSDPHVRLQLAYTLGEFDEPQAGDALGQLLQSAEGDRFLFAAAMSSLNRMNIEPVLARVLRGAGTDAPPAPNLLDNLLNQAAALGNDRAFHALFATVTTPREGRFEPWQWDAAGTLLDALERRKVSLDELRCAADAQIQTALANLQRLIESVRSVAADTQAPLPRRVAALNLLGRGPSHAPSDRSLLASFLGPQVAPDLQAAALAALGRSNAPEAADLLLAAWRGFTPARRTQALDALLSREGWTIKLLDALAAKDVAALELDASRRQRLVGHRSAAIRLRAAKLLETTGNAGRQQVVERYRAALEQPGVAARGEQLFAKTCAGCHRLAGIGFEVGPDLTSLTDKSPDSLLVAILDPNRAVEAKFLEYQAVTTSGLTHSGLLAEETGNSITLKSPEAKLTTLLRTDLEELVHTTRSAMPEGLEKDLSPRDLADLIAFIRSHVPLPTRKEFPGNRPTLVRPDTDGTLLLSPASCEIFGSTLILEPQYGNLGFWSSLDDHAVWTIEASVAGLYRVEFEWACDASVAGNAWRLEGPEGALTGQTEATDNWDTYRRAEVGQLSLVQGRQRIVLQAVEKPDGALIDLKAIRLMRLR